MEDAYPCVLFQYKQVKKVYNNCNTKIIANIVAYPRNKDSVVPILM